MANSVTVLTKKATRELLAAFAGNQRVLKLFENLASDVSDNIPTGMDALLAAVIDAQAGADSARALAVLMGAIAQQALGVALQSAEAPAASPQVFEGFAVGMIAMTVDPTNPSQTLGYGVWSLWGSGRVPVSYLAADPDFGVVEGTGGAKTASIADHAHHTHQVTSNVTTTPATVQSGAGATVVGSGTNNTVTSSTETPTLTHVDGVTGLPGIKTLPPFIVAYFWKRTA